MVSNIELVNLLKQGLDGSFYPLRFPVNAPDASSQVELTPGSEMVGGKGQVNVQVITRDKYMSTAESKTLAIRAYLEDRTDFLLSENVQIVLIKAQSPSPLYMGEDENGRHLFSMNYRLILGV